MTIFKKIIDKQIPAQIVYEDEVNYWERRGARLFSISIFTPGREGAGMASRVSGLRKSVLWTSAISADGTDESLSFQGPGLVYRR